MAFDCLRSSSVRCEAKGLHLSAFIHGTVVSFGSYSSRAPLSQVGLSGILDRMATLQNSLLCRRIDPSNRLYSVGRKHVDNLKDLYVDQLQDIHSANKQSLEATQKLLDIATNPQLRTALKNGVDGIGKGRDVVADILSQHGADPDGEFCKGMEGLVKEVHAHALDAEFGDDDVRDAMIITQYQRMTHYGLAGYGCLVAFARRLDLSTDADKLQTCLDNTYSGDREMTEVAESGVNRAAAE